MKLVESRQKAGPVAVQVVNEASAGCSSPHMLRGAGQSISEIAYGLGFENLPYFSRLFKKLVGETPGEFRGAYRE